MSQVHYLPLTPAYFSILVGILLVVLVLIQLEALRYAYTRLGASSSVTLLLLFTSLLGSYFDIPLYELPAQAVLSRQEIIFFGTRYVVPVVVQWSGYRDRSEHWWTAAA